MTTTAITPDATSPERIHYASFWVGAWRRFRRNKLAITGLVFVIIVLLIALGATVLTPYPYDKIDPVNALQQPSLQHPLGTDTLGRDMLSRIMYGARPMLLVGIMVNLIALAVGVPLGIIAGFVGGAMDWLISRVIDMFSALPWYLIVLFLVMVLEPSTTNLILALSVTSWVGFARLVRGMTFAVREQDFVEATQALGLPTWHVLTFHILPQVAPLLLWNFAAGIPTIVFAEASLSFLGMGVRPPEPSWGQMITEASGYWQYWPHMFLAPGLMIALTVLAFQGMADGLREAMDVNINV